MDGEALAWKAGECPRNRINSSRHVVAEERKPSVEEVAKHISALASMSLRHLPKRPAFETRPD